jgi:excinuclease ABC subunit C
VSAAFDAKTFVKSLPARPGVYRMLDAAGALLYVGKARHLRNRVGSYFHAGNVSPKVQALVSQVAGIEVTVTNSDAEALLLEYNLIQRHQPRFNVSLRDDKSYPYVWVTTAAPFPQLRFHRGPRNRPGRFFGPFTGAGAVRETLQQLQKLFRLRNCEDSFFENRSRPCLQYQIERCSAPCVGLIPREDYARDVAAAVKVLEGRGEEVTGQLAAQMEAAAAALEFEQAARLRDQLANLRKLQAQQIVTSARARDADVIALAGEGGVYCLVVMFIRGGRNLGSTQFFPRDPLDQPVELMSAFLAQHYLGREGAGADIPPEILVNVAVEDAGTLSAMLTARAGRKVGIRRPRRGLPLRWCAMTQNNAGQALRMRLAGRGGMDVNMEALRDALRLPDTPQRIECFDVSHTGGEGTVASCVVFGPEGALKGEYRRFNIKEAIEPGDDYAALREALLRRYTRVKRGEVPPPDLLLVDGGRGQLAQAMAVLKTLELPGLAVVAVAKGADRRAGQERLFTPERPQPIVLPPESPALHLIQRIRDEAHRFAITGHRGRRAKARTHSSLEEIAGVGAKRRQKLLTRFGGLAGVLKASVDELAQVEGVSQALAEKIYQELH